MIVDAVTELAETEFADTAFTWEGDFPWENLQLLADRGFLGINFPTAYGGGGLSEFEAMLLVESIGRVCPDTAMAVMSTHFVAPRAIYMFGSEAAKSRYLPPVIEGDEQIAIAISEPQAGSDVAAMTTTAEAEGDGYVLDGEKTWVTDVPYCTAAVTWVQFEDGLGTVVVDFDDPGVEIAEHHTNMAGKTQTQYYLNDVRIDEDDVLVRGRSAFKEQLNALNWERVGGAVLANSTALCAFERTLEYAQDRTQFDQPIGEFQGIQWKLADMATQIEASRALTYRTAQRALANDRVPDRLDTSLAKLFAAEMVDDIVDEALQIHGANGFQQGHPIEYLYRRARARRIAGGTAEIQRNTIAETITDDRFDGLAQ
ncbi:acyl-CoA dehydrogenase [Salinadaptatus halalkaliphilus]|uniref:Acyl-CoA dehydrogenase n=2 Tax=Salinadaptatus halalkaliphilus TaxID=2419781 RepID=A0A4S3TQT3_9EURY|nr:acyl-CoA dehydrogenase [Salinadaptatus halalkaliphilus]